MMQINVEHKFVVSMDDLPESAEEMTAILDAIIGPCAGSWLDYYIVHSEFADSFRRAIARKK